mmetsp:Transcript_504/g.594  ORF Transcript_504/g.594 Transcript_504/m.594 type:complete len:525 (-) Transcript_504:557-2131(-)
MCESKSTCSTIRTLLIDNYDSYTFNLFQVLKDVNGVEPILVQNDDFDSSWQTLCEYLTPGVDFHNLVISPGPGSPSVAADVGICLQALYACIYVHKIPVLGVCLGHQMLAHMYGADVSQLFQPMHGRLSSVHHNGFHDPDSIFYKIPNGFNVVRYHSLAVTNKTAHNENSSLPKAIKVEALTYDPINSSAGVGKDEIDVIMAIKVQPSSDLEVDLNLGMKNNFESDDVNANDAFAFAPCWGVQFHPESISTEYGEKLIANFKRITENYYHSTNKRMEENKIKVHFQKTEMAKSGKGKENRVHINKPPLPLPTLGDNQGVKISEQDDAVLYVRELVFGKNQRTDKPEGVFKFIGSGNDQSVNRSRCAFWLDSATCNWSDDKPSENEGQEKQKTRGRFSYMGNGDGPNAKLVEFSLDQNYRSLSTEDPYDAGSDNHSIRHHLKVSAKVKGGEEWEVVEEPEHDIFSYLDLQLCLLKKKSKLKYTRWCCHRNAAISESEKRISDWEGDFDFLCGYVGFFGIWLETFM